MLSRTRYDEDRIPTPFERLAVRGQARSQGVSFRRAWVTYLKREACLLEVILRDERRRVEVELSRGVRSIGGEAAVLRTLAAIADALNCSAYRAMFIYQHSPERECDPERVYGETVAVGTGGIDDADFYSPDFYAEAA